MVTSDQLATVLSKFTDAVELRDAEYSLPDLDYPAALGKRLHRALSALGFTFSENRWDCDKYTQLAITLAHLDHATFTQARTGIAVGHADIISESIGVGLHRVVVMCHLINGEIVARFYEPQPTPNPNGGFKLLCLRDISSVVSFVHSVSV